MDQNIIVEVCAGSVEDCMIAYEAGADRIELNSGLFLGGLTPSYAQVKLAIEKVNIPIISMIRPRGGGFHYNSLELETMFMDAKELITVKIILTMTILGDHFTQFLPLKIITRIGLAVGCNITMTC